MMNYFFPSVVGMKKTSAVTEKVGESSPAAAEGPGPVQHKTRRLVSTATEPETPADETMEEERRWSSGDASEDHLEDPEWRGSGSETACLDIDDTSETSSLRATGPYQMAWNSRIVPSSSTYCASALNVMTRWRVVC
jgi:hypothetical protein